MKIKNRDNSKTYFPYVSTNSLGMVFRFHPTFNKTMKGEIMPAEKEKITSQKLKDALNRIKDIFASKNTMELEREKCIKLMEDNKMDIDRFKVRIAEHLIEMRETEERILEERLKYMDKSELPPKDEIEFGEYLDEKYRGKGCCDHCDCWLCLFGAAASGKSWTPNKVKRLKGYLRKLDEIKENTMKKDIWNKEKISDESKLRCPSCGSTIEIDDTSTCPGNDPLIFLGRCDYEGCRLSFPLASTRQDAIDEITNLHSDDGNGFIAIIKLPCGSYRASENVLMNEPPIEGRLWADGSTPQEALANLMEFLEFGIEKDKTGANLPRQHPRQFRTIGGCVKEGNLAEKVLTLIG